MELAKEANIGQTAGEGKEKKEKKSYFMNGGEQKPVIELTELIKLP